MLLEQPVTPIMSSRFDSGDALETDTSYARASLIKSGVKFDKNHEIAPLTFIE